MSPRRVILSALLVFGLTAAASLVAAQQPLDKKAEKQEAMKALLAKAQEEYRIFFKEPVTVLEYWAALTFEIQVGKFDIAAYHLEKLLKVPEKEGDPDLLKIEEADGIRTFFRLREIKEWNKNQELNQEAKKNVETLIDRTLAAVERQLSDQQRLAMYIKGLFDASPEVRAYSFMQVDRAKHRAASQLAETLRTASPKDQDKLKKILLALDSEIIPPMLELFRARDAKDAADVQFRLNLLWLVHARVDKRALPYLWHLSSAPQYPEAVREKAKETLAYFLGTTPDKLPQAKLALTELAESYYQNKIRFPDSVEVADRDNPAKQIVMPAYKKWYLTNDGKIPDKADVLKPDDARFDFGQMFARQALELDKSFQAAQVVYLNFLLEAEFTRKPYDAQLDKLLMEQRPAALHRLLAKIDFDLLQTVLERAMREHNLAVMLPLIDALGERGEVRTALATNGVEPGLLVRALYYPDRRVQYAAVRALLRLPTSPTPVAATRVVEVLRRFLAAQPAPKLLFVGARDERANDLRTAARDAGFGADNAPTVKEALKLLQQSADFDAIVIDYTLPESELAFALTQFRADSSCGLLPLIIVAPPTTQGAAALEAKIDKAAKAADKYRQTAADIEDKIRAADKLFDPLERARVQKALDEDRIVMANSLVNEQDQRRILKGLENQRFVLHEQTIGDLTRRAERLPNTYVMPAAYVGNKVEFKRAVENAIKFAATSELAQKAPAEQQPWLKYEARRNKGQMVSAAERQRFTSESLDWLAQMARGELTGYDLVPAKATLAAALNNKSQAAQALLILARFPGQEAQQRLASVLFDKNRDEQLQVLAAKELVRHIQKHGLVLRNEEIEALRRLEGEPTLTPAIRVELAAVVGTLRTTTRQTGSQLLGFTPDPALPPAGKDGK